MLETYQKLLGLLDASERRRVYLLLVMVAVMGFVEMVGVASILPFMAVLSKPEIVQTNAYLAGMYDALNFESHRDFLIFLGVAVFCVVVFGLLFKTATQYAIYRFTAMRGYSISSRMLRGYLQQPYAWFLHRHSADLGSNILTEVNRVVSGALIPAMKLLAQATIVIFLIALLVIVQPMAAAAVSIVLGGSYAIIYVSARRYLNRIGQDVYRANEERFKIAGEAMGGIKDVKLLGLEDSYIRRFNRPAKRQAEGTATSGVIAELPRHILEVVAFGGMLMLILFLLATGDGSLSSILPILGVYAFAGLRLFPALQQIYHNMTQMRFTKPVLDKLHQDAMENRANEDIPAPRDSVAKPLALKDRLELIDVRYAYPNAERPSLDGLSLVIDANTTVGIVGGTGAGKTTAIDLMLGLIELQSGSFRIDGQPITRSNRRAWQNIVGYVPQQIFLTDDTISANIAFGIDPKAVDHAAVERAARIAELHDFVANELPQGYDTLIGERGVRLSGGQRQRIGIARALYHDPNVLILDEATSALDNLTERAVMDAVQNLGHAKTVVLVAHRLSTVRNCDVIFMMEQGRIIASGTYETLLDDNHEFRALATA